MTEITTRRLNLRLPNEQDAPFQAEGLGDFEVAKYLLVPYPYSLEMAQQWLSQDFASKTMNNARFVIELKDKTPIGGIGFNEKNGFAVLSYWLAKKYWSNGFATEAAQAIISWYFENTKEIKIISGAFNLNIASLKIQQNLGFEKTGISTMFCPTQNKNVENIDTMLTRKNYKANK